ncbi:hypothetical protein BROUX41_001769 [Berkeleyomyces rouxiae]|uniref:uncharacterized protein n=1 Tax=Berkeleyomyces rouxiae TaxID=2035830 RepID=UPI003B7CAE09
MFPSLLTATTRNIRHSVQTLPSRHIFSSSAAILRPHRHLARYFSTGKNMGKWENKKRSANRANDSGDEGGSRSQKKTKSEASGSNDAEESWQLSGKRKVTLSEFKGSTYVNIREYYEKDGEELPGKKGISLNLEQYRTLIATIPKINDVLLQKGITLPLLKPAADADAPTKKTREAEAVASDKEE